MSRTELLHEIALEYVLKGLGAKNFDAIPYDENVVLRAPLSPGGSDTPLKGKESLRMQWRAPLPSLLGETKVINTFVNKDSTAVTVEFHCNIINPACILRIVDRFKINEEKQITEQENFFDPRDVTNPGWKG
ncbi:MAG: hypothetical protein H0V14_08310 [Chitinophagaceae bacterium]|nr:hypothetical protein [Chitinophagaceae bacterium]